MEEEDVEGTKFNYQIYFVDGNLFSGKGNFLEEISKLFPDIKVVPHTLPDPLVLENLQDNRKRWAMSFYMYEMVKSAKKFFKEIKTPKNKPFILIEKSPYHFLALATAEYELQNLEKVEYYLLKEEFAFLTSLVNRHCKGIIQLEKNEEECIANQLKVCKNEGILSLLIKKYEGVYEKIAGKEVARIKVDLDEEGKVLMKVGEVVRGSKL